MSPAVITGSGSAVERVRQRLKDAIAPGDERAIEKAQKAVERAEAAAAKVDANLVTPKRRGQSAARMRALRRIPRKAPAAAAPETFSQAFDTVFKDWFQGDSWGIWRIVAKSIFAEPLTPAELELFTRHTGRTIAQSTPAREVWLACGRRAGKDYFVAALVVWLACRRKYTFSTGELGRVMLLAVDSDQADVLYSYVAELVDSVPEFRAMVRGRSVKFGMRRVRFSSYVEILIKPADKRRVRGRTLVAVVADEIAHWFSKVDVPTVKKVLTSWGPDQFDAELDKDGKAFRPDGKPASTLIPPAFGLASVNLHTSSP